MFCNSNKHQTIDKKIKAYYHTIHEECIVSMKKCNKKKFMDPASILGEVKIMIIILNFFRTNLLHLIYYLLVYSFEYFEEIYLVYLTTIIFFNQNDDAINNHILNWLICYLQYGEPTRSKQGLVVHQKCIIQNL